MTELEIKRRASLLLQKGRYDEAIAEYEALLGRTKKQNPAILNLIGDIHVKKGDYESGFENFLRASRQYSEEGLFHNAIAIGKKILRLDKEQAEVYRALGILYARQGLGMDCVKFLTEYARLRETQNDYPSGLAAFADACEILADVPEVQIAYGERLEVVERHDDAAACYEAAAQMFAERSMESLAHEWKRKAKLVRGEGDVDAGEESVGNVNDLMSLRSLDGEPIDGGGADEEPPAVPEAAAPPWKWSVFDPANHPDIPPPPPLPPALRAARPAESPGPREVPAAEISPEPAPHVPPESVPASGPELDLELMPLTPAPEEPDEAPRDGGLTLELDLDAPAPESEDPEERLEELPGIIMPHREEGASPSAGEIAEPVAISPESPEAPVAEDAPVASSAPSEDLTDFFEAAEAPGEQAVVIGDDSELVREGGDVSEVISDFREATMEVLDLDDHQSHYDLGTTYMEMELFDEAAAEFEISARGNEFALPSREMLGYCFLRKGMIDLAIRELQRGLEIPGYEERDKLGLLYNLGFACGVMDREAEAIEHFQRILEVDGDFRDTRSRLERLVQNSH